MGGPEEFLALSRSEIRICIRFKILDWQRAPLTGGMFTLGPCQWRLGEMGYRREFDGHKRCLVNDGTAGEAKFKMAWVTTEERP